MTAAASTVSRLWTARILLLLLACLVCALTTACSKCSSDEIAQLIDKRGDVSRAYDRAVERWVPAEVGTGFSYGDAVKTAESASGTVEFDDSARLLLEPSTTVRFMKFAPDSGKRGIQVETGEAVVDVGQRIVELHTNVGLARLQPGTRATFGKSTRGLRVVVEVGLASLEADGKIVEVSEGEGVEVGLGMAIVDRFGEATDAVPAEPNVTASPAADSPITIEVDGGEVLLTRPGSPRSERLKRGRHTLDPGSELSLSARDSATVRRGSASATLAGPGKYRVVGEGPRLVEPLSGTLRLVADGNDVSVEIPGGRVVALGSEGPAVGEITRDKRGTVDVRASVGKLRVEAGDRSEVISAGEGAEVSRGALSVRGRGPGFSDIVIDAGSSLAVNDAAPPTAVGVTATGCPHLSVIEHTERGRVLASAVGKQTVSLRFAKGQSDYQVRCLAEDGKLESPSKRGRVTVYHDTGTRALPRKAPSTTVSTDGRSYTVLYQNLLPAISVRWPNAPPAPSYTLSVRSAGGTKKFTTRTASHSFAAGALREGKHRFTFTSSLGRSSRSSQAIIRFDNAAPKGSITSPSEAGFAPNASVKVSGIALPGWSVVVQGIRLQLDGEHRFSQSVTAGPRGLVLSFSHPSRGTHLYLRRAAGVPR